MLPHLVWRKSSFSGMGQDCVEVAASPTGIHVRDSKNPTGPHLTFTPAEWADFLTALKTDRSYTVDADT